MWEARSGAETDQVAAKVAAEDSAFHFQLADEGTTRSGETISKNDNMTFFPTLTDYFMLFVFSFFFLGFTPTPTDYFILISCLYVFFGAVGVGYIHGRLRLSSQRL